MHQFCDRFIFDEAVNFILLQRRDQIARRFKVKEGRIREIILCCGFKAGAKHDTKALAVIIAVHDLGRRIAAFRHGTFNPGSSPPCYKKCDHGSQQEQYDQNHIICFFEIFQSHHLILFCNSSEQVSYFFLLHFCQKVKQQAL